MARPNFDPAVAGQLSMLILDTARSNLQLNGATARNLTANSASVLTFGVQQINAAALNNQTSIDPLEAAAAANVRSSQDPSYMAGLNTGAGTPRS